jgi:alpha/beta superfamily hydrolase
MNASTQAIRLTGPSGYLEGLCDLPSDGPIKGTAVISHPHPLFGGTMQNKVVQTLAKAFVQNGWRAIRFNFRGVGASVGVYDEGRGELDDLMHVIEQSQALATEASRESPPALALAGFSFGAFVTSHALTQLANSPRIGKSCFGGYRRFQIHCRASAPQTCTKTLVVHGEVDDTVPLASVMDWARPESSAGDSHSCVLNISFTDNSHCCAIWSAVI